MLLLCKSLRSCKSIRSFLDLSMHSPRLLLVSTVASRFSDEPKKAESTKKKDASFLEDNYFDLGTVTPTPSTSQGSAESAKSSTAPPLTQA